MIAILFMEILLGLKERKNICWNIVYYAENESGVRN